MSDEASESRYQPTERERRDGYGTIDRWADSWQTEQARGTDVEPVRADGSPWDDEASGEECVQASPGAGDGVQRRVALPVAPDDSMCLVCSDPAELPAMVCKRCASAGWTDKAVVISLAQMIRALQVNAGMHADAKETGHGD